MKYYFDTSALVKIYHLEHGSQYVIELYKSVATICISELAALEFMSAVYKKHREGEVTEAALDSLSSRFWYDFENRYEVLLFSSLIFEESYRLLSVYGKRNFLRTLDSIQLAFYTVYCEDSDIFVCSDRRLITIAELNGHRVSIPGDSTLK